MSTAFSLHRRLFFDKIIIVEAGRFPEASDQSRRRAWDCCADVIVIFVEPDER
jgi:hypothetical protein